MGLRWVSYLHPGEFAVVEFLACHAQAASGSCAPAADAELQQALQSKIQALETAMGTAGQAEEREAMKLRKKQMREVAKAVADPARTTEQKLQFLQDKLIGQVGPSQRGHV